MKSKHVIMLIMLYMTHAPCTGDGSRYKTIDAKTWFVAKSDEDNPVSTDVPPLRNTDGSLVQRPESEAGYKAIMEHRERIRPDLFDRPYRPTVVDYYGALRCVCVCVCVCVCACVRARVCCDILQNSS